MTNPAITLFLNSFLASAPIAAAIRPGAMLPAAPVGHLQPRAKGFAPRCPPDEAEQRRLSTFNAKQEKLNETIDKELSICRNC
jgi:hypothetical protein